MNFLHSSHQMKKLGKISLIASLLLLTACGGGSKKTTDSNGNPIVDMTRPPVTITGAEQAAAESNPDETVSYEKWQDERKAKEKAKQAEEAGKAEKASDE